MYTQLYVFSYTQIHTYTLLPIEIPFA
jgi:hypothetical protein